MINAFETYVVPMVETGFSDRLFLGTEEGNAILTQNGLIPINLPTKLYFKASYAEEWINELPVLEQYGKGYPFLFINTNGLTRDGDTFTIREMILATQTSNDFSAEESRRFIVNPILLNLRELLIEAIDAVFATEQPFNPTSEVVYSKEDRNRLPDGVDAVVFTNIKIREINTNCNTNSL